ncbi:retrotransposon protein [Cucumis melo var. makuwa]|uniref:Retrotransposon protein n=2 Tax=Cucumis melo TaxID=3656 RepID=A0A5A7TKY0_CUCMM|nr:retrotransposon protein [Cucumis melo var. makuwa]TYK15486.1 retrotransposon protein [Cucumis melo var. makuwa]
MWGRMSLLGTRDLPLAMKMIKILTMFSQGLNMSPDEFVASRHERLGDGRNASSRSKRKRRSQPVETTNIIQNVMEYANSQLNYIANWPILRNQNASATQEEVVRQLQAILKLSRIEVLLYAYLYA